MASMTLTKTRSKAGGWYVSTHGRRLTTEEMLKLQGMRPDLVGMDCVGRASLNAAVGNAMSANVLERIFGRVLYACGVFKSKVTDKWRDCSFINNGGHFAGHG